MKADISSNTTAITALQNGKVDKVSGKQLSTEDFTTAEKNKLAGLNNYDDTQVQADLSSLSSNKADRNNANQAITANSVTAPTGNFDNINASFSNFDTLLGQKLQVSENGTNWLKLSNNLIIAWGTTTPKGTTNVNLPVTFQTTTYVVIGIAFNSATNKSLTLNVHGKNTTYFVCHGEWQTGNGQGATTGDVTFNYLVVGY